MKKDWKKGLTEKQIKRINRDSYIMLAIYTFIMTSYWIFAVYWHLLHS